jgi:tetratricopeptide (TPR) repeat protein
MNTAFNAGYGKEAAQYWWFNGPEDLYAPAVGKYRPAMKINLSFRSLSFSSDMLHALPVIQDKSGGRCLQVLDPVYQDEPLLNMDEQKLFPIAHNEVISLEEKPLPADVFGSEPPHGWCYYFQKADLARQFGQWDQVLRLWQEAVSLAAQSQYGPEYLPFIEAYARKGQWDRAADLTMKANERTVEMSAFLCGNWRRIMSAAPASDAATAAWSMVQAALPCTTSPQEAP